MRKKGQVTVFLSLILVCVCSLICSLLESARTAGARCYFQIAAGSAIDSLFSQYHRELWDSYRLLFLEFDVPETLEREFCGFLKPYMETENWYPMGEESAAAGEIKTATEDNGKYLEEEILDYMRYGIWKELDLDPGHAETLLKNLKEAGTVKEIIKSYSEHSKDALKLEKTLEDIETSLRNQMEDCREGMNRLSDGNGSGFRRKAETLKREMAKMPGLVSDYERQADRLGERLRNSQEEFQRQQKDLSQTVLGSMEQEIRHYTEYTEKEGERRKEIVGLVSAAAENREIVDAAITRSLEVEEFIDEWEDSEDGDSLDEEKLWDSVADILGTCRIDRLSFNPGVKEPEKQQILERMEKTTDLGILSLVMPEGTGVSQGILDRSQFPSTVYGSEQGGDAAVDLINRLITDEYCFQFLTSFSTLDKKEVQYEAEYLLGGRDTDEENLKQAVKEILMLRQGMNLIHILSDEEKRAEARTLAATIAGVAGIAPLASVISFFIMGVWALGEAVTDVKALLAGEKVPFIKTKDSWNLSLEALLDMGKSGTCENWAGAAEGIDYNGYLKMLLFLRSPEEKYYRIMDVIQMNIRREQEDFLMSRCAYSMSIQTEVSGKHLFFLLGGPGTKTGGGSRYRIKTLVKKAY